MNRASGDTAASGDSGNTSTTNGNGAGTGNEEEVVGWDSDEIFDDDDFVDFPDTHFFLAPSGEGERAGFPHITDVTVARSAIDSLILASFESVKEQLAAASA